MAPKPKIHTEEQIRFLVDSYVRKKMSTNDIEKESASLFGVWVSSSTIYKELIRHGIPVRSKSESVSMATSTLDTNVSYLNEGIIEWIDGFLLGDGYINFDKRKDNFIGSRFVIGSVEKQWTDYAMSGLRCYVPSIAVKRGVTCLKRPNTTWSSRTYTHPDIVKQAIRWYGQNKDLKRDVPEDVVITPQSILLWYLGDGSICRQDTTTLLRFATCSFSVEAIEDILIPKMELLGLKCAREKQKNDIRVKTGSIGRFFELIGDKSPISCYDYKFEFRSWLRKKRLSDIVFNDQEKWRALYLYKVGKLDCTKSPGGRMLLFTNEQAVKLREQLDSVPHGVYSSLSKKEKLPMKKLSDIVASYTERWNARYLMSHGLVEHEAGSKFTPEQESVLRAKLDHYGETDAIPEKLVQREMDKAREAGFPYYNISQIKFRRGIKTLKKASINKSQGLYSWAGNGSDLASCFHPQMFECRRKGKMSAFELFNSDEDFRRAIWKIIALYPKITESKIREICRNEQASSRINNFPPRVAIALIKELFPNATREDDGLFGEGGFDNRIRYFDPCAGFSGRLVGAVCSGRVKEYVGVDLSERTFNGLNKTKEWLSDEGVSIDLVNDDCLKEMERRKGEDFDLIMTSPPFLDVEEYVGVPFETDYFKWMEEFIRPFVVGCHGVLRTGGKLAVYLEKIAKHDFRDDFSEICIKDTGFKVCDPVRFKMSYGENNRDKTEVRAVPVLVFEKV